MHLPSAWWWWWCAGCGSQADPDPTTRSVSISDTAAPRPRPLLHLPPRHIHRRLARWRLRPTLRRSRSGILGPCRPGPRPCPCWGSVRSDALPKVDWGGMRVGLLTYARCPSRRKRPRSAAARRESVRLPHHLRMRCSRTRFVDYFSIFRRFCLSRRVWKEFGVEESVRYICDRKKQFKISKWWCAHYILPILHRIAGVLYN